MTPPADKPSAPWEDRESSLGDLFNKLTHHKPTLWPEEREAARAELAALRQRADDLELLVRAAMKCEQGEWWIAWNDKNADLRVGETDDGEPIEMRVPMRDGLPLLTDEARAALRSGGEGDKS